MPRNDIFDRYKSIYLIQESVENGLVGGEAIDNLRNILDDMYSRGEPKEYNNFGFNKGDWTWYRQLVNSPIYNDDELPVQTVIQMINVIGHYRNTQLPQYQQLKDAAEVEINKVKNTNVGGVTDKSKIIIDYSKKEYGKVYMYIPKGIDRSKTMQINKILDDKFAQEGVQKDRDNYGNYVYPRFKKFSKDRSNLDTFYIDPTLIPEITTTVFSGMEVEEKGQAGEDPEVEVKNVIEIVREETTNFGKKLRITLGNDPRTAKQVYFELKAVPNMVPKILAYGRNSDYLLSAKKESYNIIKPYLEKTLDVTALDDYFKDVAEAPTAEGYVNALSFEKYDKDKTLIRINWTLFKENPNEKEHLKQTIKYIFPDRDYETVKYAFIIHGDYDQYVTLGRLLKEAGYNVDGLRKIVREMVDEKIISQTKPFLATVDDVKTAVNEEFPNSIFELYDLQYDGIKFLYDKKYAILGSETGGGKTVQMIYAAALKMNETHKPTVIVTLKSVQKQFEEEIISVMGEEERSDISFDVNNIKKWNIYYYDNFSSGATSKVIVEKLTNAGIGILILDELHKVKHGSSGRSKRIKEVASTIPIKWGATATISSNKPLDVRNQLLMLDHPLGKVTEGTFKRDFAGMTPSGYGGAYIENDNFEDRIRAAERLNKWLNLSGVYIRHTKDNMRVSKGEAMPDLKIDKTVHDIAKSKGESFNAELKSKLRTYKDSGLAITQLIAYREQIAFYKVDATVSEAMEIITRNQNDPTNDYAASKILVFTNFIKAGEALKEKFNKALAKVNPKWRAIDFLSSTSKKSRLAVKKEALDPNVKVLVMSMKMGGTGVSFANTFKTMIVNDFDWTPESVEQSEGRIYRINTNHDVNIIYTLDSGLDSELYDIVEKKKQLAKIIQTYRDIFQKEATDDSEALRKIIDAQKQLADLDVKMQGDIVKDIGVKVDEDDLVESFSKFINIKSEDFNDSILRLIMI